MTQPDDLDPVAPVDVAGHGLEPVTFASLASRPTTPGLPLPTLNPPLLPLASLDPEALERLVAELVSRRAPRGVQFYGRRGQKQYGLDIVELNATGGGYTLYQVKRYQSLSPAALRTAVEEYAGPPRGAGYTGPPRLFRARHFVVVTSAELDSDTANVDMLKTLREEYEDDLELDVWGAEALSGMLRDAPRLVHSVFGAPWAKEYCAYEASPSETASPRALGFVEDPADVLGLGGVLADAAASQSTDPTVAANLYRAAAAGLDESGFPGHANLMRRRESEAAAAAGDRTRAFCVLWELELDRVGAGGPVYGGMLAELRRLAEGSEVLQARASALSDTIAWPEHRTSLNTTVLALRVLAAHADPHTATLSCLALEGAVVDGLFQFDPPRSIVVETDASTPALLDELRTLTAASEPTDRVMRARQRCALADASPRADASAADVETVYGQLAQDAAAGRYLEAGGLVAARAARRFALHGDVARAATLWRQSVLASSEAKLYGDTRAALRSMSVLPPETGVLEFPRLSELVAAMPNRQELLGGRHDPFLAALEAVNAGKLPDAFAEARRALRDAAVGGQLMEEMLAWSLFGDVVLAAGARGPAVHCFVHAGDAKKATAAAGPLPYEADMWRLSRVGLRRNQAAALTVLAAQTRLVDDDAVEDRVVGLLVVASGVWSAPRFGPAPELRALDAVAAFGVRIPESAVDEILGLAQPTLDGDTSISDRVADLVVQTYWAVPSRREDLAAVIVQMLQLPHPPHNLWGFLPRLARARTELTPAIEAMADGGHPNALKVLSSWGAQTRPVQLAARRACAWLLRQPVGVVRTQASLGTRESTTAEMLRALMGTETVEGFDPAEFSPERSVPLGGTLMTIGHPQEPADGVAAPPPPDDQPDAVAVVAAGPPDLLAEAVAQHLLAAAQDGLDKGVARVQAVQALRRLIDVLPADTARGLVQPLLAVHEAPGLSALDQLDLQMDNPLSRIQMGRGAAGLAPAAFLAASEAFRHAVTNSGGVRTGDEDTARRILADAMPLLRAGGDDAARGASAVAAAAGADDTLAFLALALVGHPHEDVAAFGVRSAPSRSELWARLAVDPSPVVRRQVAARAGEIPPEVVASLARDSDLTVRRLAGVVAEDGD